VTMEFLEAIVAMRIDGSCEVVVWTTATGSKRWTDLATFQGVQGPCDGVLQTAVCGIHAQVIARNASARQHIEKGAR
jgi:hypothetical protein